MPSYVDSQGNYTTDRAGCEPFIPQTCHYRLAPYLKRSAGQGSPGACVPGYCKVPQLRYPWEARRKATRGMGPRMDIAYLTPPHRRRLCLVVPHRQAKDLCEPGIIAVVSCQDSQSHYTKNGARREPVKSRMVTRTSCPTYQAGRGGGLVSSISRHASSVRRLSIGCLNS
jgi:hypothetical protein